MVFKMRTLSLARTKEDLLVIHGSPLKRFSWKELKLATDNFSNKNVVGRGGFSRVYKGLLADGSLVAIKRCTRMGATGAELQFQSEVEIGGSQASDHPNVLRLLGYCMTRKERLLVYPFMVNTSVHSWLHESQTPLDWPTRKRIALGVAKGLAHFHYGSAFTVIHRDIKAANILLDDQFEAVVCDFGLVKFIGKNGNESESNWVQRPMQGQYDEEVPSEEEESDHENYCFTKSCWNFTRTVDDEGARGRTKWSCWVFTKNEVTSESGHSAVDNNDGTEATYHEFNTHVTTAVRGTIGHIAPEYLATGKCSIKSDVFGYGAMLLELFTGQRVFDLARLANDEDVMLLDWVKQLVEDDKFDLLVDPILKGDYIKEEMKQLIKLAVSCTKEDPEERPVMSQVIKIIENIGRCPRVDQPLGAANNLSVQQFTLPQLKAATYNFSSKNIIGKSGFNNVYRGRLKDGSNVVVKRLVKRSKLEMMQFHAAVKLGGIRHSNLLQLRGYCISGKESLLVYPFMPNRSLEWRLRPERSLALDWHARKKIALGVAKGIAYLHYDCESNVSIGRNVKPYNILVDEDFNPVLCNLRLQSHGRDDQDSCLDHTYTDGAVSCADDVYGYGITLFVLISGMVSTGHDHIRNNSVLHDRFKKLRYNQLELLLDPCMHLGDDIKDEIGQLVQLALLCTQPFPADRPEMWQVMQMLQGISDGDLKACFAFDRANLFRFDESLQHQLVHEVEIGDTMDSPKLDSEGSVSSESDQTNEVQLSLNPKQESNIFSKGKEVASFSVRTGYKSQLTTPRSRYKGITISDNFLESWKIFLSDVISEVLPTKSMLCQSGTSVDPLCPMCNEYEEDSFHLFFNCDFSRQAWLLAVGVRIDMFGFGSVKEAVDVIMKPNGARLNILPWDVEPSSFSHKGVALMHSIWTHRNQVCFDNVSPNVIQMLKDLPGATHLYSIRPPLTATQLIQESETATQLEFEAGSDADGWVTAASDLSDCVHCESSHETQLQPEESLLPPVIANCVPCESSREINPAQLQPEEVLLPKALVSCVRCESSQENEPEKELIPPVLANCVQCESSREIKPAQLQPERVLLPKVIEAGINNNQKHFLQVNIITSGGLLFSFKLNKPSVLSVVLVASLCMNLVSVWIWIRSPS